MSFMASFCAVPFKRGVLDEIWDLIESVSEAFPTYSKLYRQIIGIPVSTNCAPLVADLFFLL